MRSLRWADDVADRLAAMDPDVIHALQEILYLAFVVFLVDLRVWSNIPGLRQVNGGLIILLATFRLFYFLTPYFQIRRLSILSGEDRTRLVDFCSSGAREKLESLLSGYFRQASARRLAELILRVGPTMLRRHTKLQ